MNLMRNYRKALVIQESVSGKYFSGIIIRFSKLLHANKLDLSIVRNYSLLLSFG